MVFADILFYAAIMGYFMLASGIIDLGGLFDGNDDEEEVETANVTRADFQQDLFAALNQGTAGDDMVVSDHVPDDQSTEGAAYFMLAGNDSLVGSAGDDYLDGGTGNDQLTGRDGDDIIHAGDGADTVQAGHGDDVVHGEAGDDVIQTHGGNDTIFGGQGNDSIEAGFDDDLVFGGDGDDLLSGDTFDPASIGRGVDRLDGGAGDDTLMLGDGDAGTGGDGADVFQVYEVTDADEGSARITDFDKDSDSLEIHHAPLGDGDALTVSYDADNDVTRVSLGDTEMVRLKGDVGITADDISLIPLE